MSALNKTGPRSAIGSESDCIYRGRKFDPGLVEIDHEILSTVILFLPLFQEGLVSVTNESMGMKYWSTALSSLPRKKC